MKSAVFSGWMNFPSHLMFFISFVPSAYSIQGYTDLFVKLKQYFIRITAQIRIGLFENVNLKKKKERKNKHKYVQMD